MLKSKAINRKKVVAFVLPIIRKEKRLQSKLKRLTRSERTHRLCTRARMADGGWMASSVRGSSPKRTPYRISDGCSSVWHSRGFERSLDRQRLYNWHWKYVAEISNSHGIPMRRTGFVILWDFKSGSPYSERKDLNEWNRLSFEQQKPDLIGTEHWFAHIAGKSLTYGAFEKKHKAKTEW